MNTEAPVERGNEKFVLQAEVKSKQKVKRGEGVYLSLNENDRHFCHDCAAVLKDRAMKYKGFNLKHSYCLSISIVDSSMRFWCLFSSGDF